MNDTYNKLSELIDNCLSFSVEDNKMALIEKEIILEKIRDLYVMVAKAETEEYKSEAGAREECPTDNDKQEKAFIAENVPSQSKREYTKAKTLEEDVDLFFDTEHESYNNTEVQEELEKIEAEIHTEQQKPEIEAQQMKTDIPTPEPIIEKEAKEEDIFDNLELETEIVVDDVIKDDSSELFSEEEIKINLEPEKPVEAPKPEPITEKPVKTAEKPEQKQQAPVKPMVQKDVKKQYEPNDEDDIMHFAPKRQNAPKPQQQTQRSLNDLFNESREDNSISGQFQRAKVGDLTKAISINDKFTYIKELFHNRGEDFSDAIKKLNDCKNLGDAFDCLEELKQKYYWDSTSDAYLSFCDLLRRKYS